MPPGDPNRRYVPMTSSSRPGASPGPTGPRVAGDGFETLPGTQYAVKRDQTGRIVAWRTFSDETVRYPVVFTVGADGRPNGPGPEGLWDPTSAKNQLAVWYNQGGPQWKAIREQAIARGAPNDDKKILAMMQAGVNYTQMPEAGVSDPFDFLNTRTAADYFGRGSGAGGSAYGPYKYQSTDVSISSESRARAILDQSYEQLIGRRATSKEAQAFQQALNMMEEMNPSKSIIQGVSGKGSDSRTQRTESGFDPTSFARDYAMAQPEYADNFAATTFLTVLDKILEGPSALQQKMKELG